MGAAQNTTQRRAFTSAAWVVGMVAIMVCATSHFPMAAAAAERTTTVAKTQTEKPEALPNHELWTGVATFGRSLGVYGGLTTALAGEISRPGPRMRVTGGISRYHGQHAFEVLSWQGHQIVANTHLAPVDGRKVSVQLLGGWQWTSGPAIIKALTGVSFIQESRAATGINANWQRRAVGASAALEVWYTLSPALWTSLDLYASGAERALGAQARIGQRFGQGWSAGPELAVSASPDGHFVRAGVFVRKEFEMNEFSASFDAAKSSHERWRPFISLQWLQRY